MNPEQRTGGPAAGATIRESELADAEAIGALIARLSFRPGGAGALIPVSSDGVRAVIENEESGRFFSAVSADGRIVGCCSFVVYGLPRGHEELLDRLRVRLSAKDVAEHLRHLSVDVSDRAIVELRSLAVDSGSRGLGIGHDLIEATKEGARTRGFEEIYALVNADALPVFERAGFRRTDRTPQKLLTDCVACPILEHCTEIPVVAALD